LDINKLQPEHQGDLMFQNLNNVFTPNFGAGIYLHSDKAYFGLSVPNFIAAKRYDSNEVAIHSDKLSYYALGGYVFDLTENIKFKPAFLTKLTEGSPLQVDLSGNFMFNERFVAGIAYRWSAAFSALLGFQVSEGLYLGYSYDRETTKLVNYSSGSHEIFLRYEFLKRRGRLTSPRFF
jgi:type IX secretion system PorP/SprF family membrane protein